MPTALDLWIMVLCVLVAFDKPIPWWAWLFVAGELACVVKKLITA